MTPNRSWIQLLSWTALHASIRVLAAKAIPFDCGASNHTMVNWSVSWILAWHRFTYIVIHGCFMLFLVCFPYCLLDFSSRGSNIYETDELILWIVATLAEWPWYFSCWTSLRLHVHWNDEINHRFGNPIASFYISAFHSSPRHISQHWTKRSIIWMFPKIGGFPPNHPIFNRETCHYNSSILGETPLFLETPTW